MPSRCIRSVNASFTSLHYSILEVRNIFSAVAKNSRHPDQLIQKFVHASDITLIEQIALLIEECPDLSKIDVLENCNETQLAHHRQEILNHTRAAKRPSRDPANPDRLVNVFFQVHVQRVFQKPGITMIVFRHNENDSVALLDHGRERCVFHLLSRIIKPHRKLAKVDQLRLDIRVFLCLLKNKMRDVFALSPLSSCSEDKRNKERRFHFG